MLIVTGDAAFSHRFVLENKWARMLQVTLRALLVAPSHGEPRRRLKDFHSMWIVAIDTVHLPFNHRVMVRQTKLGLLVDVAIQTRLWIAPWVVDLTLNLPTARHVGAARSMARFAAGRAGHLQLWFVEPAMGAVLKLALDFLVTGRAFGVADEVSADNGFRCFNRRPLLNRARGAKQARAQGPKRRPKTTAKLKNLSPHVVQIGGIRPGFPSGANTFVFNIIGREKRLLPSRLL